MTEGKKEHPIFLYWGKNKEILSIPYKKLKYELIKKSIKSLSVDDFSKMWFFHDEGYTEQQLINDIGLRWPDMFNGRNFNYRMVDGYHVIDYMPVEQVFEKYKDVKVEYKFNKDWFRSEHFKKDHEGTHILFMGCSNTEGMGADYDKTWAYMLYQEISKVEKTSGFFNLSRAGYGWHKLINNFNVYIQKYSVPDYVFILHPNINRYFYWKEPQQSWQYIQDLPWEHGEDNNLSEEEQTYGKYLSSRMTWPNWVTSWTLFLNYLDVLGVKVLWGTWDGAEDRNIKEFIKNSNDNVKNFKDSFVNINDLSQKDQVEKYLPDMRIKYGDLEVRDGHPGLLSQTYWKDCFKDAIKQKGWFDFND